MSNKLLERKEATYLCTECEEIVIVSGKRQVENLIRCPSCLTWAAYLAKEE